MKKMKQKDKNLMCKQYPHRVDIDFLWITCGVHKHLLAPLHYPHT